MKDFKTKNGFFTGDVGIGTTTPGARLHVSGDDVERDIILQYNGTESEAKQNILWKDKLGQVNASIGNILWNDNQDTQAASLSFRVGDGTATLRDAMTIKANGNVGIGTTNPGAKLEVVETSGGTQFQVRGAVAVGGQFQVNNAGSDIYANFRGSGSNTDVMKLHTNGASYFNGGNVGIGTTDPTFRLDVGAEKSNSFISRIWNTSTESEASGLQVRSSGGANGHSFAVYSDNDYQFSIKNNGNVGIGTTNPVSAHNRESVLVVGGGTGTETSGITLGTGSGYSNGPYEIFTSSEGSLASLRISDGTDARLAIRSNGNVGIGTTNPTSRLQVEEPATTGQTTSLFVRNKSTHSSNGGATIAGFHNAGDYVMQIKTSGNVGIGTTNPTAARLDIWQAETSTDACIKTVRPGSAQRTHLAFYSSNGQIGKITTSGNTTSYNTSSDYRLKENVVEVDNAIERVNKLKPCRFNFIADPEKIVDGFLAHEVQEVVPEAISGEKDAVEEEEYEIAPAELDDDGNVITEAEVGIREVPEYQGIDQSKLVPLLTKAIQEQQTMIEDLKSQNESLAARISALES